MNEPVDLAPVTIKINPELHVGMKRIAKIRRVHVGVLYEEALETYLSSLTETPEGDD